MKTSKNNANGGKNIDVITVFDSVNGMTYICCNHCGLPMTTSNVCLWKEDKDGKTYNLHLVHYKCREPLERTHKGKWFDRGMLSVAITW